jgi:hypothetical protein
MIDPSANGVPRGRDPVTGYFRKGNNYSRGNAGARRMHELRQAVLDAVNVDQVKNVINKLAELAGNGDVAAARVFLEHCIGKPVQALQLSGPDGQSLGPDLNAITPTILTALAEHPEAKIVVAAALQKLNHAHDEAAPDHLAGDRA